MISSFLYATVTMMTNKKIWRKPCQYKGLLNPQASILNPEPIILFFGTAIAL